MIGKTSLEPEKSALRAFKLILLVWRPYRSRLIFGIVIAIISALLSMSLMGTAATRIGVIGSMAFFSLMTLRILGAGRVISRYLERLFTHDAMFRALTATRIWFFRHLARVSDHGIGFLRSGDMLSRLVNDIDALDAIYLRLILPFIASVVTIIIVVVFAGSWDVMLAVMLCLLAMIMTLIIPALSALQSSKSGGEVLRAQAELRSAGLDFASGLREAQIYGAQSMMEERVQLAASHLVNAETGQARLQNFSVMISSLLGQSMLAICLLGIGLTVPRGSTLTSAIALIFVLIAGLELLQNFAQSGGLLGKLRLAASRVTAFVTQKQTQLQGTQKFDPDFREICFERVDFSWQADRPSVLQQCDFVIRRGQRIAIIGPSGAGKSSLVSLLLKVVSPLRGRISIDNHFYDDLDTKDLRRHIAWLAQTTHIFADTIRNNLCLDGRLHADASLWHALDQAGLAEIVRALPDGLDSWVGEGGSRFSGGEGRRLVLARVLLSDAPIVVLDEPTAGLDAETEQQFFRTLNRAMSGRTLILVLHRLTGVEKLDSVWKLSDGQLTAISSS